MAEAVEVPSVKSSLQSRPARFNPAEWLSIRTSVTAFCLLAIAGLAGIVAVWQYGNREVTSAFRENQRYVAAVGAAYGSREMNDVLAQALQTFRTTASQQADASFEAAAKDLRAYLDDTKAAAFSPAIDEDADKVGAAAGELSPAFGRLRELAVRLGLGAHSNDPTALPSAIKTASDQFAKQTEALNSSGNASAFSRIMAQVPKLNATIREFMSTGNPKLPDEITARFTAEQRAIEGAGLDAATSDPLVAALQAIKTAFTNWVEANAAFAADADKLLATSRALNVGLLDIREKLAADAAAEATRLEEIRAGTDRQLAIIMAGVGGMILAFAALLVLGVLRPLHRVRTAVHALAGGKLNVDLGNLPRRHELGSIAQALTVFRANAVERGELEQAQARERERVGETQRREMLDLANLFERGTTSIAVDIARAAARMQELASHTAEGSSETRKRVRSTQEVAEDSNDLVSAVAGAAEELNASFMAVKDQIVHTRDAAQTAVADAAQASERIAELSSSVSEINGVLALIHEIAEQTNLLALNATIEAARAGDAGKGFAVVANEVKALANQTAKATAEIGEKVSNISTSTGSAVDAIQQISHRISNVQQYAATVADAIEEQWVATREIARNAENASSNVTRIRSDLQTVDLAADDGISSAKGVLDSATSLVEQSDRLKVQLGEFLNHVRGR